MPLAALALASCGRRSDGYWSQEKYALVPAGGMHRLALEFNGGAESVQLVPPDIIDIGADDRFIVLKQHPALEGHAGKFDHALTNFFVVKRTRSASSVDREQGIFGPMQQHEFDALAKEWHLPAFAQHFSDGD